VIKDFKKFQRTLRVHYDDLDTAYETFCEIEKHFRSFISDQSGISIEDVDTMMTTPDDGRWQQEWDLQNVIESDTAKRFTKICTAVESVLEQINDILGSIDKTQVIFPVILSSAFTNTT
jgi:ferritin-like metal-binding protein YciE